MLLVLVGANVCHSVGITHILYNILYSGKFGEEFNLMNWKRQMQIANLKTRYLF